MEPGPTYRRLLAYLLRYLWPRFVLGSVCMLVYAGTTGYVPFLIRDVFDRIFADRNWTMLGWLPALAILLFGIRSTANFGSVYLIEWVTQKIVADLRDELNARVQHLPLSYFNRTPTGTIVSRATNDVTQVNMALTQGTTTVLRHTTELVALVTAAFVLDPLLALIGFVGFPLAVLPVLNLSKRLRRHALRGQETLGTLATLLQETVQGNRIVKAFGMEDYEKVRFDEESARVFHYSMKATRARALIQPIMEMLGAVGGAGVIWYGGFSVLSGTRTQGDFMGFMAALILVYDPFKNLARANAEVQRGLASAARIFQLFDEPVEIVETADAVDLPPLQDALRIEGVRFRYPARPGDRASASAGVRPVGFEERFALDGIDLTLHRGEAVALVGASGGGKSTLADLLPRFYDPTEGRITLDGVDIRNATLRSLRGQIGIVTPVHLPVQRLGGGEHRLRKHGAKPRGDRAGSARRARARVHRRAAERLRYLRRRARRDALGRPAPAHRDRPRAPQERAHPDPRRGDLGTRLGVGAARAGRDRALDGGSDHARHRAPPRDDPAVRSHRGDRERPHRRAGNARGAPGARRELSASPRSAGARRAGDRRGRVELVCLIPRGSWRERALIGVAGWLIYLALRLIAATTRRSVVNPDELRGYFRAGRPVILAFWHGRMVMMPFAYEGRGACIMNSRHRDGALISRAIERLGIEVVRGSSSRGWVGGLKGLLDAHRRGRDLVVVPDGPRGPRCRAKSGVIQLARVTGVPVFPIACAARPAHVLRSSWDWLTIPLPGARVVYVVGEPIRVAADASAADVERARAELEGRLNRITELADAHAGVASDASEEYTRGGALRGDRRGEPV